MLAAETRTQLKAINHRLDNIRADTDCAGTRVALVNLQSDISSELTVTPVHTWKQAIQALSYKGRIRNGRYVPKYAFKGVMA